MFCTVIHVCKSPLLYHSINLSKRKSPLENTLSWLKWGRTKREEASSISQRASFLFSRPWRWRRRRCCCCCSRFFFRRCCCCCCCCFVLLRLLESLLFCDDLDLLSTPKTDECGAAAKASAIILWLVCTKLSQSILLNIRLALFISYSKSDTYNQ